MIGNGLRELRIGGQRETGRSPLRYRRTNVTAERRDLITADVQRRMLDEHKCGIEGQRPSQPHANARGLFQRAHLPVDY